MGRPPKSLADKRAIATFRLKGASREKIEKAAADAGRSLASEIEARVLATIDLDQTGLQLIAQISAELQAAAKVVDEPCWYATLASWAAAREMMFRGPIEQFRPYRMADDPEFAEATAKHSNLSAKRKQLTSDLAAMGIAMQEEPNPQVGKGLFGSTPGLSLNSREIWRAKVASLEPSEDRDGAIEMIDKLVELDEQIAAAWLECRDHISVFRKDEIEGQEAYRRHLMETARRKADAGEVYSATDRFGLWNLGVRP